ncbi:MAG: formate dehydrogenase accessory sulfurtransferase FdhD [Candidatus Bathyarchaeota archaeon]|nr:formate dehydrogenase accessory sulfurtransferase FdhD [Candidatus Bathyarchaeota archaeon]
MTRLDTKKDEGREDSALVELEIARVRLDRDRYEHVKDEIVVEDQTELYVNDVLYAVFSCSPHEIQELVVGHLLTDGVIPKTKGITGLKITKGSAHIWLAKKHAPPQDRPRLVSTSCASGTLKIPPHLLMRAHKVKSDSSFTLSRQNVFEAVKLLDSEASIFRRTGGTHASALLDEGGKVLAFSEDIGRHNAVDKVVGKSALEGASFARTLLASTGRITFEMVVKAATVGIPVIVSISAPTDKAVRAAGMLGLTLIGFARARRFNIYTCPERIEAQL